MSDLSARLLSAHAADDKNALVRLYTEAADGSATGDEAAFFLTQGYVYALDLGHEACARLRERLVRLGRESDVP